MNKTPWIFQYKREVAAKGDAASWYVGWYDHHGKRHAESCGKGSAGHNRAEKRQRRLQAELDMGVHRAPTKTLWREFVAQFERDVLPGLEPTTRRAYLEALKTFERHSRVTRVQSIDNRMIDAFVARRRNDPGKKAGAPVSPATVAKDLRLLKAALGRAVDWGYLATLPKFRSIRQPEKIPRYVTDEDFGVLHTKACPLARHPAEPGQTFKAEDWWKALIVAAFMTGLRIRELIALRLEDIDFDRGTIISRAGDNKGKRDAMLPLHPVVVEHLRRPRLAASRADTVGRMGPDPEGRRDSPPLLSRARAHGRVPRLRFPRLPAGLRDPQCPEPHAGGPTEAHAAPQLQDDPRLPQSVDSGEPGP